MEDDDEFGDLYTDVLRPLATSFQSQSQQPSIQPPILPTQQKENSKAGSSSATLFQNRPIDLNLNSDDDEDTSLVAAPSTNSDPQNQTLVPAKPGFNFRSSPIGFDLNQGSGLGAGSFQGLTGVESDAQSRVLETKGGPGKLPDTSFGGSSLMDEPDIDVVVEDRDDKDDDKLESFITGARNVGAGGVESKASEMGSDPIIPGLSVPWVSGGGGNHTNANFEDEWDSDSDDDLQIVLNDNNHGPMGVDRMGGGGLGGDEDDEDDDGEPLVIVANDEDQTRQPMITEEQEWGGEEAGPSSEGDRKDLAEAARVNGGGGVAVAPKIGFNLGYHHPFHSQFKYVRPGAAPIPGAAPTVPGGTPGQARPPGTMVPGVGRGRGDWRPTGIKGSPAMQKGFHSGYGMPAWAGGASGRAYGSGLEFTLPSHKTIFEVDIDGFEEKPWKLPVVDVTDFFNFGLNEESWKDYCKQLEQLRLETTMQGKIRVYESGRTEQDYDPDLPPELAAAAGIQEIPSELAKFGKPDGGQNDPTKGPARVRPPLPTGRPIQVESGSGERFPSIDTRKPRISDADVIIEIVCQDSAEESSPGSVTELDNDLVRQDVQNGNEHKGVPEENNERNHFPDSHYNSTKESMGRRLPLPSPASDNRNEEGEGTLALPSEASPKYSPDHRERTACPDQNLSGFHEERQSKIRVCERSPTASNRAGSREREFNDDKKERSTESVGGEQSPAQSSPHAFENAAEQEVEPPDAKSNDEIVRSERDFDADKEELRSNAATNDEDFKDESVKHISKKQKLISQVAQTLSQENDDGEDSRTARSSENSKARSGSSKDYRKLHDGFEEEEVHDGRSRLTSVKRSVGGDEDIIRPRVREERPRTSVKSREDLYPHKKWDHYSVSHSQAKYGSGERRKDNENAEGFRQRGDDDMHGRRTRVEETRKREHREETHPRAKIRDIERIERDEHQFRKQLDNGNWRAGYDKDTGSRYRDRDDISKSRNESMDDLHSKRRKEEAQLRREHTEKDETFQTHRESSTRRRRERDDVYDQRRRDDDQPNLRLREEALSQRERTERQREREEWHRIKQPNEEIPAKKDKEEARLGTRNGRAIEEKVWGSQSRGKDERRGSDKDYHSKDPGRQNETLKRRGVDTESLSQHRGREDAYARGNQPNSDDKRSRHERASTRDDRSVNNSDNYKVLEKKHKEYLRKGKESDDVDRNSIAISKRNQEEKIGQTSDMGSSKGRLDRGRSENEMIVKNPPPSRKHNREEGSSDEEQHESRRGRSKLERWTSQKDRDFNINKSSSSSSLKVKQIDTNSSTGTTHSSKIPDQPSNTHEDKQHHHHPSGNEKDAISLDNDKKPIEDKHLDTVEKLKKRSERFKLPMPGEREQSSTTKKMENDLPPHPPPPPPPPATQSETRADSEIKAERPARKRRWTNN